MSGTHGGGGAGSLVNLETLLTTLNTLVDQLEGYVDGVETLLTALGSNTDGLEGLLASPSTGAITSVNDAAADTTILASNANRKGATFFNDSTAVLYLALASVTASVTVYTVKIAAGGYYELPVNKGGVYTGVVKGIWDADASGAVRVTELT